MAYPFINLSWVLSLVWRHIFFWFLLICFSYFFFVFNLLRFTSLKPMLIIYPPCAPSSDLGYFLTSLVLKRTIIFHPLWAQKSFGNLFKKIPYIQSDFKNFILYIQIIFVSVLFHLSSLHPAMPFSLLWTITGCWPGPSVSKFPS